MTITSICKKYKVFCICILIELFSLLLFSYIFSGDENDIIQSKKHYENGVNLLNKNNIIGAIQEIEKSLELYPDNQFAHFKLGLIYLEKTKAKFFDKSPDHFKKVIDLVKDSSDSYYIDSYYYLSVSYLQLGQYDEAIAAFKEVMALDSAYPETIKIHNFLGVAYYYKDNYEQAIPQFKAALQMDSHYKIANFNLKSVNMRLEHYNIGITYFFMKNFEEAIKEFSIAIEIDTNYFAAHVMLGECYLKKGIYTEAIREFKRAMMINPNHKDIPKVLNKLGVIYSLQEKYNEAVISLRKALELDTENSEAIINLRTIYSSYKPPGIEKLDKERNHDKYIKAHLELAEDYYLIELYEEALKEYQLVFEVESQSDAIFKKIKNTYKKLADFYEKNKNYANAVTVLAKLVQIEPENKEYLYLLGKDYYLKGKYWAKDSIDTLTRVGSYKDASYYLAKAYLEMNNTKDAIDAFDRAIYDDNQNHIIPYELGGLYYKLTDYEKAVEYYKKALDLAPDNHDYERDLKRAYDHLQVRPKTPGRDDGEGESETIKEETPQSMNDEAIKFARDSNFDFASDLLKKAIERKGDSGILYNNIGNVTYFQGTLDEALANYIMADSFNPNVPEIIIDLAICYYTLKDFESASKNYRRAINTEKKYTEKYKWLDNANSKIPNKIDLFWLKMK